MHLTQKLSIAFFNKELPSDRPNGVSCQVDRLANALSRRGHQVSVYSFSPKPSDAGYRHILLSYDTNNPVLRKFMPALHFRKISSESFDIVHYHGDDFLCTGNQRRFRTFYGSACLEAFHAGTVNRFLYQLLFYLFEGISSFKKGTTVGISESTRRCIPGVNNVIHCGVPTKIYVPGKEKSSHPTILFLGDLDSRKRGRLLIKEFEEKILPSIPTCELRIVGPQKIHRPNVTYLGTLGEKQLIREYQRAWVYCLPSSYEGFGVPAIEAMACETTVVSTKNSGISEIVTDKVNGFIVQSQNLGKTIVDVLSDRNLLFNTAKEGRSCCVSRFDTDLLACKYEELYLKAIYGNEHS